jgi:hypothetical protein
VPQQLTQTVPAQAGSGADRAGDRSNRPLPQSVRLLGFWSAVGLAITYSVFDLGLIAGPSMLGLLEEPWDPIIPIGASLFIAPSFCC